MKQPLKFEFLVVIAVLLSMSGIAQAWVPSEAGRGFPYSGGSSVADLIYVVIAGISLYGLIGIFIVLWDACRHFVSRLSQWLTKWRR